MVDGVVFDSKFEARVFTELKLELLSRGIKRLRLQPEFDLIVNGVLVGKYTADFAYFENEKLVVVEAKGFATPLYKLRLKVFKACYPEIIHREIRQAPYRRRSRKSSRPSKSKESA